MSVIAQRIEPDIRPGRSSRYPAGPPLLPRLLSGRIFRRNTLRSMQESAERYGDLVQFTAFGRRVYQLNHPDLISDFFLKDSFKHHRGIVLQRARMVLGEGMLTSEEPLHMRQRRLAQPAFHRQRIAAYGEVIGENAMEMTSRWKDGATIDLRPEMLGLGLRIVGRCLFNLNVHSEAEVRKVSSAVDSFMGFLPLALLPFSEQIRRLPLPIMRRIAKGKNDLDEMIYGMIAERRNDPQDRGDLLSMLLSAVDPEDGSASMSDKQVRDECITILIAGHETTANALSFASWLLAWHPQVQSRMREEARSALEDRIPTAEDYGRLPYTAMAFAEAMRLYPPVYAVGRMCVQPYEIAGYPISAGDVLVVSQWVMHRDPRFYPDPLRFDPERFREENKAGRPRFAFFPFAAGSRQCIGEGLAWMEGVLALAAIVRDWRLSPPAGAVNEMALQPALTLRPKYGVPLVLTRV